MPLTEEEFHYFSRSGKKEKDDPRMMANFAQYEQDLPELLLKHHGEFVAYKNGIRLAIGSDSEALARGLWKKFREGSFVILPIIDVEDFRQHSIT